MADEAQNHKLYRLKVIDVHGTAYYVIGSKADVGWPLDWLEAKLAEDWLRVTGFDDEADRRPITIIVARSSIAGMLLSRV